MYPEEGQIISNQTNKNKKLHNTVKQVDYSVEFMGMIHSPPQPAAYVYLILHYLTSLSVFGSGCKWLNSCCATQR